MRGSHAAHSQLCCCKRCCFHPALLLLLWLHLYSAFSCFVQCSFTPASKQACEVTNCWGFKLHVPLLVSSLSTAHACVCFRFAVFGDFVSYSVFDKTVSRKDCMKCFWSGTDKGRSGFQDWCYTSFFSCFGSCFVFCVVLFAEGNGGYNRWKKIWGGRRESAHNRQAYRSTMQRQGWSSRSSYPQSVIQSHLRLETIRRWREVHMERFSTRRLRGGSTCPVKLDQKNPNYVDPGDVVEEEEEEEDKGVLLSIDPLTTSTKPFSQRPLILKRSKIFSISCISLLHQIPGAVSFQFPICEFFSNNCTGEWVPYLLGLHHNCHFFSRY